MLVLQGQAVGQEFRGVLALGDIVLDHRPSAARIAGNAIDRDREIRRQQAGGDQRPQCRDRSLRPAAGVGDALRRGDRLRLFLVHFGEAIRPAFCHAMRRRRVDDLGGVVGDQRDAFLRRIVRQAQDRDIGGIEEFGARRRFLAALGRMEMISRSPRSASSARICRPVVPCSPSMKIFGFIACSNSLIFQDYMP